MQLNITLSKKEKKHYFLYLAGMLLFSVLIISLIVLSKFESPFSETDMHSVMTLQEKIKFEEAQNSLQKNLDSTFVKIKKLDPEKSTPIEENDIAIGISDINNAFKMTNATDPRKNSYQQIAKFYKMYFDDKKDAFITKENIKIFNDQFEDCTVGYKERKNQIMQRENALLMSKGR